MTFQRRLVRTLALNPHVFDDLRNDPIEFNQSLLVGVLAGAAVALGTHARQSAATIAAAILAWAVAS